MSLLSRSRNLGKTIRNAARLRRIVSVFARHGFHNIAERAQLGRLVFEKLGQEDLEKYTLAERLRMAFEELGPTFVKFGQLLASRPDLVPSEFVEEFKKLQTQVVAVPFSEIRPVVEARYGKDLSTVFASFAEEPMAAASIAQVYRAQLISGEQVVVKVQRPNINQVIREDLGVLYQLAELLEKYVPETRPFNPQAIVDEFFKTLELETNFIIEANNIRRFAKHFSEDASIRIPHVYLELSGPRVLVMEAFDGIFLSSPKVFDRSLIDREQVFRTLLKCYLQMVFKNGFFHADLHAGNLILLTNNRLGLVDFGVVGRLNRKTQDAIASMLLALATEDYDRLAYEFVDLAPYHRGTNVDRFARELRDLIAPFYGLTMKNVNLGKLLLDSTAVAGRHHLTIPSELILFFKSMVTIEGLGHIMVRDFDLLPYTLDFATDLVKDRYDPMRVGKDFANLGRDAGVLLADFPRQLRQIGRKLTSPDFAMRVQILHIESIRRTIEKGAQLIFSGLVIGALILSGTAGFFLTEATRVLDLPLISVITFSLAFFLALRASR